MKKASYFFIAILFIISVLSCTTDTDIEPTRFSPPSWIIGTWKAGGSTFTFTSDNVTFSDGISTINFKENYILLTVNETSSDDLYSIELTEASLTYLFEKVTETIFNYTLISGGTPLGPVPFIKQ